MISVAWAAEETNLVVWTFAAPWTFDEFRAAHRQTNTMIDGVEGSVDMLYITSAQQFIPLRALTNFRTIIHHRHPRQRYAVIVGAKTYLVTLMTSLTELIPGFGAYLRFARSEAESYTIIGKLREQTKRVD
ncbi:MAG: hypothetical protein LCI00_16715 [Chloroflexi bacterium]|nr:hypothetical protein [Chloroflexota bacterium]MCC6896633.1 hypothetical protein [Anaerolineae bacterium]